MVYCNLDKIPMGSHEIAHEALIHRYGRNIYALVLNLIGGDRDKAFELAAVSLSEAAGAGCSPADADAFVTAAAARAVVKGRAVQAVPVLDDPGLVTRSPEDKAALRLIKQILFSLPFGTRALLLLRDQMHLPYKNIGTILGVTETDARMQTTQARAEFRKKMKELLEYG